LNFPGLAPERILTKPLRWRRPRLPFVNSMLDLFHEDAPDEWIDRVFAIMAACPQHLFQALTKRAERVRTIRLVTICSSSRGGPPRHGGYLTRWPAAAQYKDRY
jgi:protein gp37